MKSKMPALAEWLLTRFGIPQRNESLMGDLAEESSSGRSALWLWRETAVAIGTTVARDIRNHTVLATRAIATGWALTWGWQQIVLLFQPPVAGSIVIWSLWYLGAHYHEMKSIPNAYPDVFATNVTINCVVLVFTLAGGFFQKPKRRLLD